MPKSRAEARSSLEKEAGWQMRLLAGQDPHIPDDLLDDPHEVLTRFGTLQHDEAVHLHLAEKFEIIDPCEESGTAIEERPGLWARSESPPRFSTRNQ